MNCSFESAVQTTTYRTLQYSIQVLVRYVRYGITKELTMKIVEMPPHAGVQVSCQRLVVLPIAIAADMSFQRWATVPSER